MVKCSNCQHLHFLEVPEKKRILYLDEPIFLRYICDLSVERMSVNDINAEHSCTFHEPRKKQLELTH